MEKLIKNATAVERARAHVERWGGNAWEAAREAAPGACGAAWLARSCARAASGLSAAR